MRVEMRLARPIFMEKKFAWFLRRFMQIVIDAARFLASRPKQTCQRRAQFSFLAGPGLKRGGDSDGFCAHKNPRLKNGC
jgi:hypothetical protein